MAVAVSQRIMMRRIKTAARKIARFYQPEKIILFGSYAYGTPDSESDADLLIIKQTAEKPLKRGLAVRKLLDWDEDAVISPLVLTPEEIAQRRLIGDQFITEILQRGEILYEN